MLATTTLLASLASVVGHGRAVVTSLMPVGASPETYEPSPADIVRAHNAGLILENGAGLEAWLGPDAAFGRHAKRRWSIAAPVCRSSMRTRICGSIRKTRGITSRKCATA